MNKNLTRLLPLAGLVAATTAAAVEYRIGTPELRFGMEIAAVYLQPIRI